MTSPTPNSDTPNQGTENPSEKKLNTPQTPTVIYKKGDIVWADLGYFTEKSRIISKTRPSLILKDNESDPDYAVVVQSNLGNKYSPTVILVPITSTIPDPQKNYPFLVRIGNLSTKIKNFKDGIIKCDQIFTMDKVWLKDVIGTLSAKDLLEVDKAIKASLDLKI